MIIGRIVGNIVPAVCHPGLDGVRLLLCEVLDDQGNGTGKVIGTADWLGAGAGNTVLVVSDGDAAEANTNDPKIPLRNVVMGIIDDVEVDEA
ncbi:EutN/CcmL family microcompartment protein [Puniceicoccaceae bacterium K14]|nr:EutN/CcmL family microcompartment protein [Puniceicoccaceae bacterium K14]